MKSLAGARASAPTSKPPKREASSRRADPRPQAAPPLPRPRPRPRPRPQRLRPRPRGASVLSPGWTVAPGGCAAGARDSTGARPGSPALRSPCPWRCPHSLLRYALRPGGGCPPRPPPPPPSRRRPQTARAVSFSLSLSLKGGKGGRRGRSGSVYGGGRGGSWPGRKQLLAPRHRRGQVRARSHLWASLPCTASLLAPSGAPGPGRPRRHAPKCFEG